jgi:hypothetical protein
VVRAGWSVKTYSRRFNNKDDIALANPGHQPAESGREDRRFAIREIVRAARQAALATLQPDSRGPLVSLVTVAPDVDGSPILLLSRLAEHTRNIAADNRVSLLFDGTKGYANPQEGPRVSVVGRIERRSEARLRRRFLARHPGAKLYADFADFAVHRVVVERVHWVGGFGRAAWLEDGLGGDPEMSLAIAEAEERILAEINHGQADAIDEAARRLLKRRGKGWRVVAIDPDGCDIARGSTVLRLGFGAPLTSLEQVGGFFGHLVSVLGEKV